MGGTPAKRIVTSIFVGEVSGAYFPAAGPDFFFLQEGKACQQAFFKLTLLLRPALIQSHR